MLAHVGGRLVFGPSSVVLIPTHAVIVPTTRSHFGEYIQKNIHLYGFRHNYQLNTNAVANFVRNELAKVCFGFGFTAPSSCV